MKNTREWFTERIGKRVYRKYMGCSCKACMDTVENGILIDSTLQVEQLYLVSQECGIEYFDEPVKEEEVVIEKKGFSAEALDDKEFQDKVAETMRESFTLGYYEVFEFNEFEATENVVKLMKEYFKTESSDIQKGNPSGIGGGRGVFPLPESMTAGGPASKHSGRGEAGGGRINNTKNE